MKFPFNWYNKFGTLPSSYREAMSYEEQILWLCQQIENLKTGTANYNYDLLENKPSINGVILQGNVTATQLGIDYNYASLLNKPAINGITLIGNKTLTDLGIQGKLTAGTGIRISGNVISATGGSGGTDSYNELQEKPLINGVTIENDKNGREYNLQNALKTNIDLSDTGKVANLSSYQTGDVVPTILPLESVQNSGYIHLYVSEGTFLDITGNYDLYKYSENKVMQTIFTSENQYIHGYFEALSGGEVVINFYELNTYTPVVTKIWSGEEITDEAIYLEEENNKNTSDITTLLEENFDYENVTVTSQNAFYNVQKASIGHTLPASTYDNEYTFVKIDIASQPIASNIYIRGYTDYVPLYFFTLSFMGVETVLDVSNSNLAYDDLTKIRVNIPEGATYMYVQFKTTPYTPELHIMKIKEISGGGSGASVTKLTSNLVLQASTPLTLNTGFYQTVVDANNNYGVYFHTATTGNLILGGNELFYFDNTSQTLIFENKNYFYDTYETDWLIEEHTNITNEILNDRNKIPTSQAVYNALQNSGTFYTTLTSTLTLNLDGTNDQNLTDGYYLTDLVQYYDDNGLQTASYLSYSFCYYNSSQKRLTLTGIQKGLTYYDTFARYIDSTDGWLYSYKQFVNVLDNSKISTSISSSSTNSEVAGALACYEASLDNYSTTEHVVGTWTDGKPLYEKTITGTVPTATADGTYATNNIAHNISNPKIIFATSKFIYPTSATFSEAVDLPYFTNSNYQVKCSYSPTNVVITNGVTHYNGFNARITIRYTKTTD